MKKLICLSAALIIALTALCTAVSAADSSDVLTITEGGKTLATVSVGSEFIYRVGVNAGDNLIYSGQGYISYDSGCVRVVEHGAADGKGNVSMESYSFPESIQNTALVANFLGQKGIIRYNFTKPTTGVDRFDDVEKPYFKIRFKAVAPGTTELRHVMQVLSSRDDGGNIMIFNGGKPNEQLDPIPYQMTFAELPSGLIGDADGDNDVTVMDATFLQRAVAGVPSEYSLISADVNGDGEIDLKDALAVRRYKAGMSTAERVGEWVFESELNADNG